MGNPILLNVAGVITDQLAGKSDEGSVNESLEKLSIKTASNIVAGTESKDMYVNLKSLSMREVGDVGPDGNKYVEYEGQKYVVKLFTPKAGALLKDIWTSWEGKYFIKNSKGVTKPKYVNVLINNPGNTSVQVSGNLKDKEKVIIPVSWTQTTLVPGMNLFQMALPDGLTLEQARELIKGLAIDGFKSPIEIYENSFEFDDVDIWCLQIRQNLTEMLIR